MEIQPKAILGGKFLQLPRASGEEAGSRFPPLPTRHAFGKLHLVGKFSGEVKRLKRCLSCNYCQTDRAEHLHKAEALGRSIQWKTQLAVCFAGELNEALALGATFHLDEQQSAVSSSAALGGIKGDA